MTTHDVAMDDEEWEDDVEWATKSELDTLIADSFKRTDWPSSQTTPEPTVPVDVLFNTYPVGEIQDYNTSRTSDTELQLRENKFEQDLKDARKAAEVHRAARQWLQSWLKPGLDMRYICEMTENKVRELLRSDGLEGGIAFPMGCNVNEIVAHFSPNPGDEVALTQSDVVKFDLGVHVNGRIIDSAFTMCFNDKFNPLLKAVKESTNAGIRTAGIDVRISDVSAAIQEVMESHEIELDGKVHPIVCVADLCGHNIDRYRIHSDKTVPIVKNYKRDKMDEGEFFAIETFGSTGQGRCDEDKNCSHFMRNYTNPPLVRADMFTKADKRFMSVIDKNFGTLCFCPRYLERLGETKYQRSLARLVDAGVIDEYPPLVDIPGSYTAQFEHTIVLRPTCKEVLSRGSDY
jgi:methionyl aminopeptidase